MNFTDLPGLRLVAIGVLAVLAAAGVVVVVDDGPATPPVTTAATSPTSSMSTTTTAAVVADAAISCVDGFAVTAPDLSIADIRAWLDRVDGVVSRLLVAGDLCGGEGDDTVVVGPFEQAEDACQVLALIEQSRTTEADDSWKIVEGLGVDDPPPPTCGRQTGAQDR